MPNWIADRRIYVSEDGRIVDEAEPGRKTLVCAEGAEVTEETCRRYEIGPFAEEESRAGVPLHPGEPPAGEQEGEGLSAEALPGDENAGQESDDAQPEPETAPAQEHPGQPHAWRKDGTCRCGSVKPETGEPEE